MIKLIAVCEACGNMAESPKPTLLPNGLLLILPPPGDWEMKRMRPGDKLFWEQVYSCSAACRHKLTRDIDCDCSVCKSRKPATRKPHKAFPAPGTEVVQ